MYFQTSLAGIFPVLSLKSLNFDTFKKIRLHILSHLACNFDLRIIINLRFKTKILIYIYIYIYIID